MINIILQTDDGLLFGIAAGDKVDTESQMPELRRQGDGHEPCRSGHNPAGFTASAANIS